MSDTVINVIKVENLSKRYVIGHQRQERYTALRDVIGNGAKSFWQGLTGDRKINEDISEEFWALKDVSFEVKQGDRARIVFCESGFSNTPSQSTVFYRGDLLGSGGLIEPN
jgi:lipopolysaccharide transport system ATP-binding protein